MSSTGYSPVSFIGASAAQLTQLTLDSVDRGITFYSKKQGITPHLVFYKNYSTKRKSDVTSV